MTIATWIEEQRKERANAAVRLCELCEALIDAGVTSVIFEYSGSGDQGCIESVEFRPKGVSVAEAATEELEDAIYELLPEGFEINEGSSGEYVLNVAERTLKHEHTQFFISEEKSEETIDLKEVQV